MAALQQVLKKRAGEGDGEAEEGSAGVATAAEAQGEDEPQSQEQRQRALELQQQERGADAAASLMGIPPPAEEHEVMHGPDDVAPWVGSAPSGPPPRPDMLLGTPAMSITSSLAGEEAGGLDRSEPSLVMAAASAAGSGASAGTSETPRLHPVLPPRALESASAESGEAADGAALTPRSHVGSVQGDGAAGGELQHDRASFTADVTMTGMIDLGLGSGGEQRQALSSAPGSMVGSSDVGSLRVTPVHSTTSQAGDPADVLATVTGDAPPPQLGDSRVASPADDAASTSTSTLTPSER